MIGPQRPILGVTPRSGGPVIELCGVSLRRFQNTECRKFRLTRGSKNKCSDMRRFAILFFSFFLLFLLSDQSSMAQDFMGWPNFNSVPDTTKNPETKTQAVRSKTGSRYAGRGNWERYIIFESPENVHFSEISCGSAKAPDVSLSPSNPVAKIVLLSTSASRWKWNASLSSTPTIPEHN
jgi:hypothetical protein